MNLIVGTLWLVGAFTLFAYEFTTGQRLLTIRGLDISTGWLLLVLAAYNFARWYQARAQDTQRTSKYLREARLRQSPSRPGPRPIDEPDPTFDFSNSPTQKPPQPPSSN